MLYLYYINNKLKRMIKLKNKKRKNNNVGKVTILLSFIMIMIVSIYALISSDAFNSKFINIQGNKNIPDEEVINTLNIREDKNIFMYNINEMEEVLLTNKYIKSATVQRKFPNGFDIIINERKISSIIKDENKYAYIDEEGKLIEEINNVDEENSPYIIIELDYNITDNKSIDFDDKENETRIPYLLSCIRQENLGKKLAKITLDDSEIMNIYTKEGITVLMNNDVNIDYNVSRMSAILADLQGRKETSGTVDLTAGNHAVYTP